MKINYHLSRYKLMKSDINESSILYLERDYSNIIRVLNLSNGGFREAFLDLTCNSYSKLALIEKGIEGRVEISTSFTGPSLFASQLDGNLFVYDSESSAYVGSHSKGNEIDEVAFIRMLFSDNLCARPASLSLFKGLYRCPPGATITVDHLSITCRPRFNELRLSGPSTLSGVLDDMVNETYSVADASNKRLFLLFSGGMDSLLIGSVMKSKSKTALSGIHLLYHNLVSRTTAIATSLADQLSFDISYIESASLRNGKIPPGRLKKLFSSGTGVLASIKNYFYYESLAEQFSAKDVLLVTGQNADTLLSLDHKFPATQLLFWERIIPTISTMSHRYGLYVKSHTMLSDESQVIACLNKLSFTGSSTSISEHGDTSDQFGCYVESLLKDHYEADYLGMLKANSSQFVGYSELALEKVTRWYRTCGNVELNYDGLQHGLGAERHVFFNHPKFITYGLNSIFDWKDVVFVKPRFSSLVKKLSGISHRRAVTTAVLKYIPSLLKRKLVVSNSDDANVVVEGPFLSNLVREEALLDGLTRLVESVSDSKIRINLLETLKKIESRAELNLKESKVILRLLNIYYAISGDLK